MARLRIGYRKLHIGIEVWQYRIGRAGVVILYPGGKRHFVTAAKILNISPDEVERARWKRTNRANIGPSRVKEYILSCLLDKHPTVR